MICYKSLAWIGVLLVAQPAFAQRGQFDQTPVNQADESYIFTPPGFAHAGKVATVEASAAARLTVTVVDKATGQPTPCRINVVGPDGNFYQPAENPLGPFSLNGNWPKAGQGNRPGKAPIRYFGHYFYCRGEAVVEVPPGKIRVEAAKGLEYAPQQATVEVHAGQPQTVRISLERTLDMVAAGYWSGDPHLHFPRGSDAEDQPIFDLMAAEDIRYGVVMCYNETDRYSGAMQQLVMPQLRGVGRRSKADRGPQQIISGQEYRNQVYGHLNLFLRDDLVAPGSSYDPNHWPVFGMVGAETRQGGGVAIHAHGGYAQEIYADLVQQATSGVELLQFGIYRGIGLENWYRVLNCGFRFPAVGASDYPACRKLGDCLTYVAQQGEPTIEQWLAGLASGRSFITTGPMLLLTVDGRGPGDTLEFSGDRPHKVTALVRARSDVTPVTHLQLIVGGKIVREQKVSREAGQREWLEISEPVEISESTWIAARAFSQSPSGSPDAEAHTNPVYLYCNGHTPYHQDDLDWLAGVLDAQIAEHSQRDFADRARVVEYFQKSRDRLEEIRRQQGQPANVHWRSTVETSLAQRWLPKEQPLTEVRKYIEPRVAELPKFETSARWEEYAAQLRRRILDEIVFRGAAAEWRQGPVKVEWLDSIEGFADYRIRKLRYEVLPGMWIPALLYEPLKIDERAPVVLNINGHDPEGKAAKDEQIRSINCAKRGMLALHPEWFGMGQLRTPGFAHGKMNQLDLCGTSGLAPFYLNLSRGLDVLCSHPQADKSRVAVTGLSGGGWQTAWISALDERVSLSNPVAGYTGLRTAIHFNDMGDSEQAPSDFGTIADGTHLTALRAPRSTLLTYNAADDCCFKAEHTLTPLLAAARPVFALFAAKDRLRWHVNHVPGTHNYERDNRQAFYGIADETFFPRATNLTLAEFEAQGELKTATELEVPLPAENLDFSKVAAQLAANLTPPIEEAGQVGVAASRKQRRARLAELLKVPTYEVTAELQQTQQFGTVVIRSWLVRCGKDWTLPVVEFAPTQPHAMTLLVLSDSGMATLTETILEALADQRRVFAVDPWLVGQSQVTGADAQVYFGIAVASIGSRPLGVQAGQLAAIARWIQSQSKSRVEIASRGRRTSVMGVVAAAVEPGAVDGVTVHDSLTSFRQLIEESRAIEEYPELFPFGLLAEFELSEIEQLANKR